MKRKGFSLVELIVALGLLGLLSLVILNAATTSTVGLSKIERRSILLDQCQRIVETLKVESDENNELFDKCIPEGDYLSYPCSYISEGAAAYVKLVQKSERLQTYTVRIEWEEEYVELTASRITP